MALLASLGDSGRAGGAGGIPELGGSSRNKPGLTGDAHLGTILACQVEPCWGRWPIGTRATGVSVSSRMHRRRTSAGCHITLHDDFGAPSGILGGVHAWMITRGVGRGVTQDCLSSDEPSH